MDGFKMKLLFHIAERIAGFGVFQPDQRDNIARACLAYLFTVFGADFQDTSDALGFALG
ncbi:hypothetical protein DSECCO2_571240 [anaerobic digester metagenome]